MSRNIQQIKDSISAEQAGQTDLTTLNSPSQTGIYNLWKWITAAALWIHESLWDKFKTELETTIDGAAIGTDAWVQDETFKFQYDLTTPQILTLNNFVPSYNPFDVTKQLITQCSVKTLPNKIVSLKVAKSSPPAKLAAPELTAYQGYLDKILFAGVQYIATSKDPDLFYLDADVTYDGQYATTISASTVTAIETYLSSIPFDGIVKVVSLVDAIQNVVGVTDCVINNLALRSSLVLFANKTYLVQNNTTIFSKYTLDAGYVIQETSPNDLAATLTFIPE